jgi:hypothetical protein
MCRILNVPAVGLSFKPKLYRFKDVTSPSCCLQRLVDKSLLSPSGDNSFCWRSNVVDYWRLVGCGANGSLASAERPRSLN